MQHTLGRTLQEDGCGALSGGGFCLARWAGVRGRERPPPPMVLYSLVAPPPMGQPGTEEGEVMSGPVCVHESQLHEST